MAEKQSPLAIIPNTVNTVYQINLLTIGLFQKIC